MVHESTWCTISALVTISTSIVLHFNIAGIAYFNYQLLLKRFERHSAVKQVVRITGWGLIVGAGIAGFYFLRGEIGPFKGLYFPYSFGIRDGSVYRD
jgi:hypothetical protein